MSCKSGRYQAIATITSVYHPDDYLPGNHGEYSAVYVDCGFERGIYFDCLEDALEYLDGTPYRMESHLSLTDI